MVRMLMINRNNDSGNGGGGAIDFSAVMAKLSPEEQAVVTGRLGKANEEAQGLRGRLKGIEDLHGKLKTKLNLSDITDSDIEALSLNVKKASESGGEIANLKQQIQQLTANFTKVEQEKREGKRNESIVSALGKIGVRSDAMANAARLVAFASSLNANGEWEFEGQPLDKYIETWKAQNQYMIGNPIKGGNGNSGAPNMGNGNVIAGFISEADYLAMGDAERRSPETQKRVMESMGQWGEHR